MKISFSFILILFSNLIFGQDIQVNNKIHPEIFQNKDLKKGIYLTFKEFLSNNPSVFTEIKFGNKKGPLKYIPNNQLKKYSIYIDSNGQFIRYENQHWGICDGKDTYVLYHGKYLKLTLKEKYSVFTEIKRSHSQIISLYSYKISDKSYLLNSTNGEIIFLNKKNMGKLLQKENITLYNEYLNDKQKKYKLFIYLDRLNDLYKNK